MVLDLNSRKCLYLLNLKHFGFKFSGSTIDLKNSVAKYTQTVDFTGFLGIYRDLGLLFLEVHK